MSRNDVPLGPWVNKKTGKSVEVLEHIGGVDDLVRIKHQSGATTSRMLHYFREEFEPETTRADAQRAREEKRERLRRLFEFLNGVHAGASCDETEITFSHYGYKYRIEEVEE